MVVDYRVSKTYTCIFIHEAGNTKAPSNEMDVLLLIRANNQPYTLHIKAVYRVAKSPLICPDTIVHPLQPGLYR